MALQKCDESLLLISLRFPREPKCRRPKGPKMGTLPRAIPRPPTPSPRRHDTTRTTPTSNGGGQRCEGAYPLHDEVVDRDGDMCQEITHVNLVDSFGRHDDKRRRRR